MTHPIIKTDNYILITSDEEIKEGDIYIQGYGVSSNNIIGDFSILSTLIGSNPNVVKNHCKKIIAHLPLNNSHILEGVAFLPPLPDEEDEIIENLENYLLKVNQLYKDWLGIGFKGGYHKAKEKYKFTEEDMKKALLKMAEKCWENKGLFQYQYVSNAISFEKEIIHSILQPKLPVGFKCEMELNPVNHAAGLKLTGNLIMDIAITQNYTPKIINGVMQGEWIFE